MMAPGGGVCPSSRNVLKSGLFPKIPNRISIFSIRLHYLAVPRARRSINSRKIRAANDRPRWSRARPGPADPQSGQSRVGSPPAAALVASSFFRTRRLLTTTERIARIRLRGDVRLIRRAPGLRCPTFWPSYMGELLPTREHYASAALYLPSLPGGAKSPESGRGRLSAPLLRLCYCFVSSIFRVTR